MNNYNKIIAYIYDRDKGVYAKLFNVNQLPINYIEYVDDRAIYMYRDYSKINTPLLLIKRDEWLKLNSRNEKKRKELYNNISDVYAYRYSTKYLLIKALCFIILSVLIMYFLFNDDNDNDNSFNTSNDVSSVQVYVTEEGEKYHTKTCRYIEDKDTREMSLNEAKSEGYTPCSVCEPDDQR